LLYAAAQFSAHVIRGTRVFNAQRSGHICAYAVMKNVIVHRRVAEDAKRMNIFLSAERAERKKLSF